MAALAVCPLLQEAAQEAEGAAGSVQDGATACRVLYRLAHYADGLYRNIEASWLHRVAG